MNRCLSVTVPYLEHTAEARTDKSVNRNPLPPQPAASHAGPLRLQVGHYMWTDLSYRPLTEAQISWNAEALKVTFHVEEQYPSVTYFQPNDPVYRDSCVEFFWQPVPEQDPRYLNLEWNAAGTLLLQIGSDGRDRLFLDVDPAVFGVHASLSRVSGTDRFRWTLGFAVPFAWLSQHFPSFRAEPGTCMRGNFYKCGDGTPQPHFGSWNPVDSDKPNFHLSQSFRELILG